MIILDVKKLIEGEIYVFFLCKKDKAFISAEVMRTVKNITKNHWKNCGPGRIMSVQVWKTQFILSTGRVNKRETTNTMII